MGIKKFFQSPAVNGRNARISAANVSQEGYWGQILELCTKHVINNIGTLQKGNLPYMDWAETRYNRLIHPNVMEKVIEQAKKQMGLLGTHGQLRPDPVMTVDRWYIVLSVWPSSHDKDFIKACPNGSFEELAWNVRSAFRQIPGWQSMDFAHWILLISQAYRGASVHLNTMWSYTQSSEWVKTAEMSGSKAFPFAPLLMAVDLMREDPLGFAWKLHQADRQVGIGAPPEAPAFEFQAQPLPQPLGPAKEANSYFISGVAHQQKGQTDVAIHAYDMAIQLNPSVSAYYFNRAIAYYELENFEKSLVDYNEAIRQNPSDSHAYYLRGLVYLKLNKFFEHLSDNCKAIELDPDNIDALLARAAAYIQISNYEEALADLNHVITLQPREARGYVGRAYVYRFMNRHEEANRDMQTACQLDPSRAQKGGEWG
jgi:tetratricopeptide (TPR) repeat protein